MATAEVGVFGGSGFYSFLDDVEEVEVETPYGAPSAPLFVGEVAGKRVAFLPRHGVKHELPPHRIPYRANVWAMRELGVRRIIGPCASGALQADLQLGELGIPVRDGGTVVTIQGPRFSTRAESKWFPDATTMLAEGLRSRGVRSLKSTPDATSPRAAEPPSSDQASSTDRPIRAHVALGCFPEERS